MNGNAPTNTPIAHTRLPMRILVTLTAALVALVACAPAPDVAPTLSLIHISEPTRPY